jgi:predicted DNA-binding antitoxin AbrB/MazE fold protein
MTKTIEAVFDGTVLHPQEPLPLEAHTRVRITIESLAVTEDLTSVNEGQVSFLDVARSLKLEGPPDWSSKLSG